MLTSGQLTTIKSDITANTGFNGTKADSDGCHYIANIYNKPAVPDYYVWKNSVSVNTIISDPSFNWARVDVMTAGKERVWNNVVRLGTFNPSNFNVRSGIQYSFSGTADAGIRSGIFAQCRRNCTVAEKLFATTSISGSGVRGSINNPDTLTFEGFVSPQDIDCARN